MIDHMRQERLALLGQPPHAESKEVSKSASASLSEPTAAERRDQPARFMGKGSAFEVLPALALDFDTLGQRYLESRKPALDVGASFSTVALQATFHSIPIHSTDLRCDNNRHIFLANIRRGMEPFKEIYTDLNRLPAGFRCYPVAPREWEDCLNFGIKQVNERMVQCGAERILMPSGAPAPDRCFSVVFSHHAVPKYSTTELFLRAELPEMLRVTDRELRLFPLLSAGPGDEMLHLPLSVNRQCLEHVANSCGFDLEISISPMMQGGATTGTVEPGFDMLGVFRRRL